MPSTVTLEQAVRSQLNDPEGNGLEIYTEYLDVGRFANESHYRLFREYLREKYRERRPDVIYTTAAASFAGTAPNELLPGIPLVFNSINTAPLPQAALGTNMTGIVAYFDYRGTVDLVFRLQPTTRRIVVICSFSASERSFLKQVEKLNPSYGQRAAFEFWTNQPMTELQTAVSRLPVGTVVLTPGLARDVSGRVFFHEQALELLLEHCRVPVFVFADTQVGSGAVGGSVVDYDRLGVLAGQSLRRILDGAPVSTLPITVVTNGTPMFDWRALRRWGISEALLPPGSVLKFHEPDVWEKYRWWIVGTFGFCCLQTALIIGLIVNRAKRRDEHAAATLIAELSSRFINLPAHEVDTEIEAAQRRICECLGLDISALWQRSANDPDDLVLTHVCRLVDGPPIPEPMSAREYFPWCLQEVKERMRFALASLKEAPAGAARDVEIFRQFGIKANLMIPLTAGDGPTLGAVSFATVRAERPWPEEVVERLQVVAQIFASALARKRADQELRESEARLGLAAEAAAAGLWRLDLATHRFWITSQTRELFAFGADEVVTFDRFLSLVHLGDQEMVRRNVQQVLRSKGEFQVEYRILRSDGRVRWMQSQGRVHVSSTGQPAYLMGVTVDVTPRKQSEEARRQSEARLASAVEVAGLGFYDMGSDPGQVFVDERLHGLLGLTPEDSHRAQEFWMEHIHPDDRERVQNLSRKVLGGELQRAAVEYRYQHPQRGTLWFSHVSRVMEQGSSGHGVRRLGVICDITERKRAEEALRNFSARLISTQEEERSRLARELHDDITQRLARLAIDVGRSGEFTASQAPMDTGRNVREELIRLSEDVHALSYRLHPSILQDLGLAEALKAEAERFERQGCCPIEFKVRALPDSVPPEVALCLFRVAQEALRNAARHSAARVVQVYLQGLDDGVQLAVRDDGCGFDPAVQRDRPSLGLLSMQERVRLLAGELEIESAPGQGTTVLTWLPILKR